MTATAATYDLVMLIDPQVEDAARAKIVADTRSAIEAKGELVRHDEWGERALTYPIDRHTSAEYHLLQFHVGDDELLGGLDHTLRITDGLLRFRVIKLKPGVPDAPDMKASAVRRPEGESAEPAQAPVSAEPPSEPTTEEAAAEPAPVVAAKEPAADETTADEPTAEESAAEPAPVVADEEPATKEPAADEPQLAEPA